jgi:hypothetical protein
VAVIAAILVQFLLKIEPLAKPKQARALVTTPWRRQLRDFEQPRWHPENLQHFAAAFSRHPLKSAVNTVYSFAKNTKNMKFE